MAFYNCDKIPGISHLRIRKIYWFIWAHGFLRFSPHSLGSFASEPTHGAVKHHGREQAHGGAKLLT